MANREAEAYAGELSEELQDITDRIRDWVDYL